MNWFLGFSMMLALGGTTCQATLISNGSFESGIPYEMVYYWTLTAPDSTTITDWVVSSGSVDYINTIWNSADGARSVDMNGTGQRGSIYQTFATVPGHLYRVDFAMSGNPAGGPRETALEVSAAGSSQIFTYLVPLMTATDLGWGRLFDLTWEMRSWDFLATGPSTTLTFTSQDYTMSGCCGPMSYGPAIDYVVVNEIPIHTPEPGTSGVLALALGAGMCWLRRRR